MDNQNILKKIRDINFSFSEFATCCPELLRLKEIPQNAEYHAEGDVYRHTEMVCEKLIELSEWKQLKNEEQELLFLAAAFHDIGKARCTKKEDGKWVSPKHTIIGEKEFRAIAYREEKRFGLTFEQREQAAGLVRYHGLPVWFWSKKRTEYDLLKAAESVPLRLLYLLSKADILGRESKDGSEFASYVEWFADYAKELNLWEKPYYFANAHTKFQYFYKNSICQDAQLYDNGGFDVFLMSGLPLAGKDSWILKYGNNLPMISLDEIREELRIPPTKNSEKVARIAVERAKNYLRAEKTFFWNATNIVQETRQKLIRLFADYGARVHILYLEVSYQELLERNKKRARDIPWDVLEKMIDKLELPAPWEAHKVHYILSDPIGDKQLACTCGVSLLSADCRSAQKKSL